MLIIWQNKLNQPSKMKINPKPKRSRRIMKVKPYISFMQLIMKASYILWRTSGTSQYAENASRYADRTASSESMWAGIFNSGLASILQYT